MNNYYRKPEPKGERVIYKTVLVDGKIKNIRAKPEAHERGKG